MPLERLEKPHERVKVFFFLPPNPRESFRFACGLFTVSVCTMSGIMEVHLRFETTAASGISHSNSLRSNDAAFSECVI